MTDAEGRGRMVGGEDDLESTFEDIRAHRKRDPNFDRAIAEFVEAEIAAKDDPAEGRVVTQAAPPKQPRSRS